MALVSRSPRDSPPEASSASLARWGGAAVCLGALSYGASGYLDKPDASGFVVGVVLPVLEALTALSFLGGVLGLYYWPGGGDAPPWKAALAVGSVGTVLGLFDGLDLWEPDWWTLLFLALLAVGLGMVREGASRVLGVVVLASGALGWVSLLTDPAFSGVLVPTRPLHVASAASFCLSCLAWGAALFLEASRRA
jgi:hypothetical protein